MKASTRKIILVVATLSILSILLEWGNQSWLRKLRITPNDGYSVEVVDDRESGGSSIGKRVNTPGKWHFTCKLGTKYEWPYCEIAVHIGEPGKGLNLSRFESAMVKADYRGVGSHQMRIFLRDYNPAYSRADKNETWKVQGAFVVPPKDGSPVRIDLSSFPVASWWIAENHIPPEHAKPSFDNVPLIQFGSSTLMEPGLHDISIEYIEFQGRWLRPVEMNILLGLIWLCGIGALLYRRFNSLDKERRTMNRVAQTDPLTGVRNRSGIIEEIETLLYGGLQQAGKSMGVIFADIDHFKRINDGHGHDTGDVVLQQFAATLQSVIRGSDYLVRWGGEEFVLFLPLVDLAQTERVATKLREKIHAQTWPAGLHVTASFGVTICTDELIDAAIKRADEALYRAKHNGRDRIEVIDRS